MIYRRGAEQMSAFDFEYEHAKQEGVKFLWHVQPVGIQGSDAVTGLELQKLEATPDGSLVLSGQPVPKSRLQVIKEVWLVRHLWLARLANAVYLKVQHPMVHVPDPTKRIEKETVRS